MTPIRDDQNDGPTLQTYVETRFNLLTESLKDLASSQAGALGSAIEALKSALIAADIRYQQRFDAQKEAIAAALEAAKDATTAAQFNADRAVAKAEAASDKRFESLNELRKLVNDVVGTMMPRVEAANRFDAVAEKLDGMTKRIDEINNRFNTMVGESSGNRRTKDDTRAYLAVGISILFFILAFATFLYTRYGS